MTIVEQSQYCDPDISPPFKRPLLCRHLDSSPSVKPQLKSTRRPRRRAMGIGLMSRISFITHSWGEDPLWPEGGRKARE
jgi:hypothetical protein